MSTTEWVARRAKVSRVTGYRRFWDRHALVTAKMMREGRHLTARVADAMASAQTPTRPGRETVVSLFAACVLTPRATPST